MNELRKRARTGNDRVAGAPAAEAPELPKLAGDAAATKIAELQAELEAIKQSNEAVVDKLNAKVDALQTKNESQLREIKDLTSALQWAYAVEEIPRRHWLEQGHSEEYADAMGTLLNSMKQNIATLRVGGNCETITIDFDIQDEDENYIRADHDELLMPYWKELAAALRHWSEYHADGKCLEVQIVYIELPKAVLDLLRPAFEESRIKRVYFENCRHSSGYMADFFKKVLQSNHFITEVGFSEIKFTPETLKALCEAIKSRNAGGQFIKSLALWNCFDGGIDTQTLKTILASITTTRTENMALNLSYNGVSSREATVIASFLTSNPCLRQLDIDFNQLNDADATVLSNSLSANTRLRKLSVENNRMTENGRLAFLRAVFDISSLSLCAASNHTCRVCGLERDISVLNKFESAPRNKWRKIFAMLALSSENSFIETALLRGVPAQLIPLILDKCNHGSTNSSKDLTDIYLELTNTTRCQKHDVWDSLEETKSLNCLYNLTRSWVTPSIFV